MHGDAQSCCADYRGNLLWHSWFFRCASFGLEGHCDMNLPFLISGSHFNRGAFLLSDKGIMLSPAGGRQQMAPSASAWLNNTSFITMPSFKEDFWASMSPFRQGTEREWQGMGERGIRKDREMISGWTWTQVPRFMVCTLANWIISLALREVFAIPTVPVHIAVFVSFCLICIFFFFSCVPCLHSPSALRHDDHHLDLPSAGDRPGHLLGRCHLQKTARGVLWLVHLYRVSSFAHIYFCLLFISKPLSIAICYLVNSMLSFCYTLFYTHCYIYYAVEHNA